MRQRPRQDATALAALALLALIAALLGLFWGWPEAGREPTPTGSVAAIELYLSTPSSAGGGRRFRGGPDEALAQAIRSAQSSIDLAVYSFNLWSIRDALLAAHERRVTVRMVIESDNILAPEIDDLVHVGIPVIGDRREPLMHHKFVILDRQEVWTGSMNLTVGSAYADYNNLLRLRSGEVAENFEREFEEMFVEDRFGPLSLADTPHPDIVLDGRRLQVLFSPDDGVAQAITAHLRGARARIDLMAYAFTSDEIGDVLLERAADGVRVRVVVDGGQAEATGSEYVRLRQAGLDVRAYGGAGLLHHKVIILDEAVVITGSYNFTRSAEEYNDEAVVILHDPELAQWYSAEFERLYRAAG